MKSMDEKMVLVLVFFATVISICNPVMALTYRAEDLARGAMWANTLVDAGDEYKDANGDFYSDGTWHDAHNLLGPIPDSQNPYSPVHSSIVTMNNNTGSWVQIAFEDGYGDPLKVWNDPDNPEGYDAIVWGNAFYAYGQHGTFSEPGTIYLSQDLTDWYEVPFVAPDPYCNGKNQTFDMTPGEGDGLVYPGEPWMFDENGDKTGETGYAGGDAFDMATAFFAGNWLDPTDDNPSQVGLNWFQYIMVTGEPQKGGGPDCDSIFAFSVNAVPEPTTVWLLVNGLLGLGIIGFRRTSRSSKAKKK